MMDVVTIREAVKRAKKEGLPVSEYSLRTWIKSGAIPVRRVGKKVLLYYPNLVSYLQCANVARFVAHDMRTTIGVRPADQEGNM